MRGALGVDEGLDGDAGEGAGLVEGVVPVEHDHVALLAGVDLGLVLGADGEAVGEGEGGEDAGALGAGEAGVPAAVVGAADDGAGVDASTVAVEDGLVGDGADGGAGLGGRGRAF